MKHDVPSGRERLMFILAIAMVFLSLVGLWQLLHRQVQPQPPPGQPSSENAAEPTLAGADYFLPEKLYVGERLPCYDFVDAAGEPVNLLAVYPDTCLVLMFWGSWCPYCEEQLENLEEFRRILESEGNSRLILVNKTDTEKEETVESGEHYLAQKGWQDYDRVYDVDLKAYRAYGMKRIPTTIVLDAAGCFRAAESSVLDGDGLRSLLTRARTGHAQTQLAFLKQSMTGADGGIYTALHETSDASPQGHDVLSESMGLMMCSAVALGDEELFTRCWTYVSEKMERGGVFAWYVQADGKKAGSNALLDDLRIARALYEAEQRWGGYGAALQQLATAILKKNVYRGQLSSFYDFRQRRAGHSVALAYGDFAALEMLEQLQPEYAAMRDALLETVRGGFISEDFPLYYSAYDYQKHRYSHDSLNTAEALLTVYHLAQVGQARQESLQWLKHALREDTLAARYHVDGTAAAGYEYDSTAVFAIAALIGQTCDDAELYRLARTAMERSWAGDEGNAFYGAFSLRNDGSDIQAFDQLLPLSVYVQSEHLRFLPIESALP